MSSLRNFFAVLGLAATLLVFYAVTTFGDNWRQIQGFDPDAFGTWLQFNKKMLAATSSVEAAVWKVAVADGVGRARVIEVLRRFSHRPEPERPASAVLSSRIESVTGQAQHHLSQYTLCDPVTSGRLIALQPAFSAYFPCRVSLLEDEHGKLWLYTLNLDPAIHGGRPLPRALKQAALETKKSLLAALDQAARGQLSP